MLVTRATSSRDERRTAQLHAAELDGMFVRFGTGFLRAYHASFRRSPHAVSFVVVGPEGVVGFLVGTTDNEAHYQWLARHAVVSLGLRAVLALGRRPRVAIDALRTRRARYLRALRRRLSAGRAARRSASGRGRAVRPQPSEPPDRSPTAGSGVGRAGVDPRVGVLTHVAVAPSSRGSGAGRRLVAAYEHALGVADVGEARLITDPGGDAAAFYRRLGWSSVGIRAGADGSEVEEFVRTW